jgi:predicted HicB family RNase H-like nuclease
MKESKAKPTTSVRVDPQVLHQARIAAVTAKKTLGKWLEEAILEKIQSQEVQYKIEMTRKAQRRQ